MAVFDGRHALVTGGSRGIGRAVAGALARSGATVTVVGRNEQTLENTVSQGDASAYFVADVADQVCLGDGIKKAVAARGPFDILVANAGGAESTLFLKADTEHFQRMLNLNFLSVVHSTRAVLGGMVARGYGRIVAVASTAGLKGYTHVSAYCAAKHAVVGLVRALALETATSGVTVNAVCPGYTDTDLVRDAADRIVRNTGRTRAQALGAMLKNNPSGRLIRPEEVAAAVLFLCSAEAGAVTGATLTVAAGEV